MEKIIDLNYRNNKVRFLVTKSQHMVNLRDVADYLQVDLFDWLKRPDVVETINVFEEPSDSAKQAIEDNEVIRIESSEQIFGHMVLFFGMTMKKDVDFYLWYFDVENKLFQTRLQIQHILDGNPS